MDYESLWKRYHRYLVKCPGLNMTLDLSRMDFGTRFFSQMQPAMDQAFTAMDKLEAGEIANPDEQRMVGHYWLRNPSLAPNAELKSEIEDTLAAIDSFATQVHRKQITPPKGKRFTDLLLVGIGGSALGPQLVADALGKTRDKLNVHFLDNTDPDGINRTIEAIGNKLKSTLVLVVSKSGGTPETHNGMMLTKAAFAQRGLTFNQQAVAITGKGSKLEVMAQSEQWLEVFPMWDWVGGRTSVMSAVGLLPMALQGINIKQFLDGAARMDKLTRKHDAKRNPAAALALMWHYATGGVGAKDMVILPYKDRLLLMSRYLQQLVMESLGKELDLDGNVVNQGINVFGNKGSTDQHAYVQQLRDGVKNFFATFIVVLQDVAKPGKDPQVEVADDVTAGDYLSGFWQGTRQALYEKDRHSVTITLDKLDPKHLGALIALYERAVGFYGVLVNINAYHQPGVEAGKKAAASVLEIQQKVVAAVQAKPDQVLDAEQVAQAIGEQDVETVYHILEHLAANKRFVQRVRSRYQAL